MGLMSWISATGVASFRLPTAIVITTTVLAAVTPAGADTHFPNRTLNGTVEPQPPPLRPPPAWPTATLRGTRVEVPIRRSHGGFMVDGVMNGTRRASFILDSGATNVVIPRDIIVAMVREGTVTQADYVGPIIHKYANDGAQRLEVVRLKSLTVGGRTVQNVLCSAGDSPRVFLLGQSFLGKLTSWSIHNARSILILED